jgi:ribosome maturation factor RimP
MIDVAARVEDLLREAVLAKGLELVHVEYQPQGANFLLRIYIDKQGGVNLKDCEQVSKHAAVLLEVEDLIPHHYLLEVSSPGLERPLFTEMDYRRFVGNEISLITTEKVENRKKFTGCIQDFAEGLLSLKCDGTTYTIPFEIIRRANLVYRFQ